MAVHKRPQLDKLEFALRIHTNERKSSPSIPGVSRVGTRASHRNAGQQRGLLAGNAFDYRNNLTEQLYIGV
jgi:hypothetical protein